MKPEWTVKKVECSLRTEVVEGDTHRSCGRGGLRGRREEGGWEE